MKPEFGLLTAWTAAVNRQGPGGPEAARSPDHFFTSGHLLAESGGMISAAGMARTTLK
jgi:hypothetical protein